MDGRLLYNHAIADASVPQEAVLAVSRLALLTVNLKLGTEGCFACLSSEQTTCFLNYCLP